MVSPVIKGVLAPGSNAASSPAVASGVSGAGAALRLPVNRRVVTFAAGSSPEGSPQTRSPRSIRSTATCSPCPCVVLSVCPTPVSSRGGRDPGENGGTPSSCRSATSLPHGASFMALSVRETPSNAATPRLLGSSPQSFANDFWRQMAFSTQSPVKCATGVAPPAAPPPACVAALGGGGGGGSAACAQVEPEAESSPPLTCASMRPRIARQRMAVRHV
eukprot:TRINITY_DN46500_c0_g1_i1.p2 TRINITY_DN46500_c0_g1~~TRINITY_DN46500_c0_g1_i1.p2  ORF type:complete len:218 (+),score=41.10 TRINITY_DN46500_c0_g1_i1:112-765(+)